jgi:CheY-like chemotaxis protein
MNPKKVLLIDDHSAFTRLLKLTLERKAGCIVREENNSALASATAQEFRPDIVFCDVDMPNIDGGEVARQIRNDPDLAHVPFIFLTTLVDPENGGSEIGGFPYLSKPVSVETLLRCIEEQTAAVVL